MFKIFGINFYGYGLLIGLGVWLAMEISLRSAKLADKKLLEKGMWWAVGGGVVGARIYHVVDYWQKYYSSNLIKIFYLWEGGLGIYGALFGGIIGIVLFCYFNKLNFYKMLDSLIIGVPLAQAIGRIGNWINGELVGKNGEPLFAYESLLNLILFGVLYFFSRKQLKIGRLVGVYFVGYGVIRAVLESMRVDNQIWRIASFPVAEYFSLAFFFYGSYLILRRKQS